MQILSIIIATGTSASVASVISIVVFKVGFQFLVIRYLTMYMTSTNE